MQKEMHPETLDFEMLYREFFTPVFQYVLFRTKNYDLACDITQSAFLKYYKQENGTITISHARSLIFMIARNLLIDYWRSGEHNKKIFIEEIDDVAGSELTPEEEAVKKEDSEFVNSVLSDLTDIENEIISMRLTLQSDYSTISKELNITESNARKIYSRAIRKVGDVLKNSGRF